MSTIEEARAQARETLPGALARLVENRLGKSLAREADKDMIALRAAANAIVALLDATEPPKRSETSDAQREAAWDEWAPRLTDLTKSAPPYAEAFDAGWLASQRASVQAVEPAEDEREALVEVIRLFFQNWRAIGKVSAALEVSIDSLEGAVDDLIELTRPRPITDEMVEAAAREYHERGNGEGSYARASGHVRTSLSFRMECALRAAEEARR